MKIKETGCNGRKERGNVVKCDGSCAAAPRCKTRQQVGPRLCSERDPERALCHSQWQCTTLREPVVEVTSVALTAVLRAGELGMLDEANLPSSRKYWVGVQDGWRWEYCPGKSESSSALRIQVL